MKHEQMKQEQLKQEQMKQEPTHQVPSHQEQMNQEPTNQEQMNHEVLKGSKTSFEYFKVSDEVFVVHEFGLPPRYSPGLLEEYSITINYTVQRAQEDLNRLEYFVVTHPQYKLIEFVIKDVPCLDKLRNCYFNRIQAMIRYL